MILRFSHVGVGSEILLSLKIVGAERDDPVHPGIRCNFHLQSSEPLRTVMPLWNHTAGNLYGKLITYPYRTGNRIHGRSLGTALC